VESGTLGQYYARKVGETQRQLQHLDHERRRLVRIPDHAYINMELPQGDAEGAEIARRAAEVEAAALEHRDEILRLSIEVLKLQDRLHYYRQLEAMYADGTLRGPN
jgi:hypothetical protein